MHTFKWQTCSDGLNRVIYNKSISAENNFNCITTTAIPTSISFSWCTSHLLLFKTFCHVIQPAGKVAITVTLPESTKLIYLHTALLPFTHMSCLSIKCHILKELKGKLLLYIGQFCDKSRKQFLQQINFTYANKKIFLKRQM